MRQVKQAKRRLSAVVLSHNSQLSLKAVLTSVSFADELIVLDDNSTDNSLEIAKSFPALVYKKRF